MTPGPCDSALAQAEDSRDRANNVGGELVYTRYRDAQRSARVWREVAVMCPGRFSEGVMASAQMDHLSGILAARLGIAVSAHRTAIDEHTDLQLDDHAAAGLALAQDRAGFAMEVLASRHKADKTLLALSDRRKALASGFAARTSEQTSREKVYSVQTLLKDPDSATDDATGLLSPTSAYVEMDAVREQLGALAERSGSNGNGNNGVTDGIVIQDEDTARTLASLLSEEAAQAMRLGYPAHDTALFAARLAQS